MSVSFKNVYRDLVEAQTKLNAVQLVELSDEERRYRGHLIDLCSDIAEEHGNDED